MLTVLKYMLQYLVCDIVIAAKFATKHGSKTEARNVYGLNWRKNNWNRFLWFDNFIYIFESHRIALSL